MKKTFVKWLALQKKRHDPVGDLARDFFEGGCCPEAVNSARALKKHMTTKHDAIPEALEALKCAVKEWRQIQ